MFKKLLAGLLAASLVLSLASCNNGGGETSSTESTGGDSSAAESTGGNEGGDGEYCLLYTSLPSALPAGLMEAMCPACWKRRESGLDLPVFRRKPVPVSISGSFQQEGIRNF